MDDYRGKIQTKYQLRCAAGQYYLLNMEQKGIPYERPLVLNSNGAELWQELAQGKTTEQIAESLGQKYNIDTEEIKADVLQFYSQLREHGVFGGEE